MCSSSLALTLCVVVLVLVAVSEALPARHPPGGGVPTRERSAFHPHPHPHRRQDVSVASAVNLTLCSHEVQVDFNRLRIPQSIDHVVCRENNCKCTQVGDYRCTQLYSEMEVAHTSEATGEVITREKVQVKYGCFCATRSGYHIKPGVKPRLPK